MRLDASVIPALARGCALYGGGGGGEPGAGRLMALAALDAGFRTSLVRIDELPGDGLILPVAMIGAPTVGVEKLPRGDEGLRLRDKVSQLLGREVVAFVAAELGGINGVVPVAWAARAGLPLVDADLIGRAFPGLQYTVPALRGHDPNPIVMVDERGNVATIDAVSSDWANRYAAATMVAAGALMGLSLYPMTVAQAAELTVPGSMSRAIRAGRQLMDHRDDPIRALAEGVGGRSLFEGKVVDVDRRTDGGYTKGSALIEGLAAFEGQTLRLEFQNENLVAMIDGVVIASVSDIITVLDLHSAWPIVTEALRYGQRVGVIGIPCEDVWRTEAGIDLAGPRAFGYDVDYIKVEDSHAAAH